MNAKDIKFSVLIVDDEQDMCLGAERCLKKYVIEEKDFPDRIYFDVSYCNSGAEALNFIQNKHPDILILDYKLPDMNGLEILERIENRNFLTIMITAFASLDVAITATKKGAFDFLAKPFTPDELRESVKKAAKALYSERKMKAYEQEKKLIRFEFISILAHELKSPLAAIEGYLRLMDEKIKGEDLNSYDNMIKRSIERINSMRKLIADIIDLTKLESGRKQRNIEEFNLKQLLTKIIDEFSTYASTKNVKINLISEDIFIKADQSDFEMLVSNFLSNAIKYNKENGTVDVIVERMSNNLIISFKDTGIGIKEDDLKKLFNEFVRIKNEYTRGIEGSGLGLSIVKKIVEYYGGSIDVSSEFGKGSVFSVKLPNLVVGRQKVESL